MTEPAEVIMARGMQADEAWSSFWSDDDAARLCKAALTALERAGMVVVRRDMAGTIAMNRFRVGDRVRHVSRGEEGTVTGLENGVNVTFDGLTSKGNLSVGIYDENWFRMHPNNLIAASPKAEGEKR